MTTDHTNFRIKYGPWALVAGASVGLGAEFATQLAAKGLNLVLIARRANKLAELSDNLIAAYGIEVRQIVFDLTQIEQISTIQEKTNDIEVGLLIVNAALSLVGPFFEQPLPKHLTELNLNCAAALSFVYLFGQPMLARGQGGIVLMSSMSAYQGTALVSNYAATKGYNLLLAEGLWEELREQGIDVLACSAGVIRTPNYLASKPKKRGVISAPEMEPDAVVSETLAVLGKQPSFIPGRTNRLMAFLMNRLLPRRVAIKIMGKTMRSMYS